MVMPTVDTGPSNDGSGSGQERRLRRPVRLALGTGAGVLGEVILGYHNQALETISIVCDVGLPTVLILVLIATILFGSEARHERAFRLLRWLGDKPEPPGPAH